MTITAALTALRAKASIDWAENDSAIDALATRCTSDDVVAVTVDAGEEGPGLTDAEARDRRVADRDERLRDKKSI